jgi:hypothetical protein
MLLHIIIEIVLAVAMLFAASTFWQLRKRARFLKEAMCSPPFLESLISREELTSPPPRALAFAQMNEVGYVLNIKCVVDADRASQRRVTLFHAVAVAVIFVGSYFLGPVYLAINVVLFFLTAVDPISPSAKTNAMEHIFTIGLILHKWRLDNATECDQWIEHAWSLRPLYEAVRKAQ